MPEVGVECDPADVGMDVSALSRALDIVRARGAVAHVHVMRHGRVVLDRAVGCRHDALFWIFSAGKPYLAVLVHRLADEGLLRLDDPVAAYWPGFARNGKAAITVRHVLRHRTGLAAGAALLGDALAMRDWDRSVRRVERARPRWPAGAVPGYSPLAYGFILGELVARVTGRAVPEVLREEVLSPIGASDTYAGLPDERWPDRVPVRVRGAAGAIVAATINRRATRRAVIPAAGVSTTARDLARLYLVLLRDSGGLLRPGTLARATAPSSDGEVDRVVGVPIRWSQGFQLGGPRAAGGSPPPGGRVGPMGALSSPRTFGHNGSNCCIAWADPDRDLIYAYLTNRIDGRATDIRHHAAVADAVIGACG